MYEEHPLAPRYLLLRNIKIDRDKDGRVRLDIVDIKDALWDALEEQNKRAKGTSIPATPVVSVEWAKEEGR